jgi:hypothetical protein
LTRSVATPASPWFVERFCLQRLKEAPEYKELFESRDAPTESDLEGFFDLSRVLAWSSDAAFRDALGRTSEQSTAALIARVARLRQLHEEDPEMFDRGRVTFERSPATFIFHGFVELLVVQRGLTLKRGDGVDFNHALIAATLADLASLDKAWKRRLLEVRAWPGRPTVFYRPEAEAMVTSLEALAPRQA